MADISKKRSRKSKLVPRQCNSDSDDDDGDLEAKLQKIAADVRSSIDIKEEPEMSMPTTSVCPITEMYATKQFSSEMPMIHVSEPPMQIDIKVEVERFDESLNERETEENEQEHVDEAAFLRRFRSRKFVLTNDLVTKCADKIKRYSTSIADHLLDVAVRNTSGHIERMNDIKLHPWDELLQNALHAWKDWQSKHFLRDGPLFYKCYYCHVSYWYLHDFKEHLSGHKLMCIALENHTQHEVNIIAYKDQYPTKVVMPPQGNCGRCGKKFKEHSLSVPDKQYSCHGCNKVFHTCLSLGFHVSNCPQLGLPKTRIKCQICKLEIPSVYNTEHLHTVHSVRSDVPILNRRCQYSTCDKCDHRYIDMNTHVCYLKTYYRCEMCFRSFQTEYLLQLHIERNGDEYECPICETKLKNSCKRYEHLLTHTNNYIMVFKCTICVKYNVFLFKHGLFKHLRCAHKVSDSELDGYSEKIIIPKSCLHSYFDNFADESLDMVYGDPDDVQEVRTGQNYDDDVQIKNEIKDEVIEIPDTSEIEIKAEPVDPNNYPGSSIKVEPVDHIETTDYFFSHDIIVKEEFDQDIDVYEDDIIKLDMDAITYEIKEENDSQDNYVILENDESQDSNLNNAEYQDEIDKYDNGRKKKTKRQKMKLYRCNKCGFQAFHKTYRQHVEAMCAKTLVETDKISCTQCKKSFRTLGKYLTHLTFHGYSALTCPDCLSEVPTYSKFVAHVMAHVKQGYIKIKAITEDMSNNEPEYQCTKCGVIVETDQFFVHWESHVSLGPTKKEDLSDGESSTPKVVDLLGRLHMRTKQCYYCHRVFMRFNECKRHQIEHLLTNAYECKDKYRELRCQICAAGFRTPELYRQHMREHASLPVYRCDICNKSFSDSSNFTKHKKVHNFKVFVCDLCKKKFQSKNGLIKHLEMHTKTPIIKCEECNKIFHFQTAYRRHMKYQHHNGVKEFPCIVCNIRFGALKHKWRHMWEVHKERKSAADCPVCHKSFRIFSEVRRHMKAEHFTKLTVKKLRHEVKL
ncbi:unnamed protein product [Chrysodeixis includens]|uniref:C2H2-type domain-containing protein n=1 Tax=Chrysodeixis includens TaxID=689277 RepID=A0A9P0BZK8_CHRIL|nr:unnamed protein product [Chrysodeixis includens]